MPEASARRRLERDRADSLARIAALQREFDSVVAAATDVATDDEHDPEGATLAFERASVVALLRQAESHLADTEAALRALADGRYGRCESCGTPIGAARLRARPAARTCIGCAGRPMLR